MEVPFRFIVYSFFIGIMVTGGIVVLGYELVVSDYVIDVSDGENITVDEFIDVLLLEQDNQNFSVPSILFEDIRDIEIKSLYNREYTTNNRLEGMSMQPTMYEGNTLICIKDFTKEELQVNSMIVYRKGSGFISHRIVGISETGSYITKGDNNIVTDGYVEYEDVYCLIGGIIY